MATRSARDNKALNAKHAEFLRAMLRRPENRVCADCKRNDPRWASTNLGCFMCIRCSGIHRSMGVHITRIKSIDLDTWTPEQVAYVGRWGNKRANAYWEAHLRPGHIPPDHKMESFIRSKYESKRWAMEGPMPEPETLDADGEASESAPSTSTTSAPAGKSASRSKPAVDLLGNPSDPSPSSPQPTASSSTATAPKQTATGGGGGGGGCLFDIDFSPNASAAAAVATAPAARKDVKNDILSLFSSAAPPPAAPAPSTASSSNQLFGGSPPGNSSLWGGGPTGGGAFGGPAAPVHTTAYASPPGSSATGLEGLSNHFSGLQMGSAAQSPQRQQAQPQAGYGGQPSAPRARAPSNVDPWGGGGFTQPISSSSPPFAAASSGFGASPPAAGQNSLFGGSGVSDPWASSTNAGSAAGASDPFGAFSSGTGGGSSMMGGGKSDVFADIWK